MLQVTPQMRLMVAIEPVDFRKGIDGLVALCKQSLGEDPLRGSLFAFRNRRGTAVKVGSGSSGNFVARAGRVRVIGGVDFRDGHTFFALCPASGPR